MTEPREIRPIHLLYIALAVSWGFVLLGLFLLAMYAWVWE